VEAFVLAGGESKRFGSNKALYRVGDETLLEILFRRMSDLFDKVRVLTKDSSLFKGLDFEVLDDVREECCPLSGIYSGLRYLRNGKAFFLACDLPLVQSRLVNHIVEQSQGFDAAVPRTAMGFEPLCAVYDVACLDAIEDQFVSGNLRVVSFLNNVKTKVVEEDELKRYDKKLVSFVNVNTPDALGMVLELLAREKGRRCS